MSQKTSYPVSNSEDADLRAMSYGFGCAAEMKAWGERMERERIAEQASSKGAGQPVREE